MAERIISPGVFTNEVDQSFLAGGVAQLGAAIVGPTVKGPALVPTKVTSFGEFTQIFGSYTDDSYVPYVVQDYLRNGNVITVTRLLYEDGYTLTNGAMAIVATSASVSRVTHVLHPTQAITTTGASAVFEDSVLLDAGSGSFAIKISGSYNPAAGDDAKAIGYTSFLVAEGVAISGSIVASSNKYVNKVFGASPKSVDYPVYVQYEDKTAYTSSFANLGDVTLSLVKYSSYDFLRDYNTAATPWITSQKIGTVTKDLFRFHTLSHGTSVNHEVKVGIFDVRTADEVIDPNGYGTFSVEVRRVNTSNIVNSPYASQDTDKTPDTVEIFQNVNLDPMSPRYIVNVIGDRYQTVTDSNDIRVEGDYPNKSKFIRVEVTDSVKYGTNEKSLIPFGFRALSSPIPNASGANLNAATYVTSQVQSTYSSKNYFGFDFANATNLNYLAPLPFNVVSTAVTGSNTDFYLGNVNQDAAAAFPSATSPYSGSVESALTGGTFTANISSYTRKFIVPFQGGFDGTRPNLPKYSGEFIAEGNVFGFDCSTSTSTGTKAYNKAFTLLSNTDYYDMNMIITPGILNKKHSAVTTLAINLAETRQDTFYVMDSNPLKDAITDVVSDISTVDSSYTATYWPWVRVINPSKNVPVWVPPSVVLPGVLAFNDKIGAPWYAPAGLTRGGLTTVSDTYVNLSQAMRDTLYEARVNPIANFPNEGVVVWGQKTLQSRPSALDRVSVRRLLLELKKFIASSTRYLVFEQNTDQTRNIFLAIVNPYMEQVKTKQGLYAFRVVMDSSNNTPDVIDRNILYGQIFLQPTRTAEFIVLDFNIQPTGAQFPG